MAERAGGRARQQFPEIEEIHNDPAWGLPTGRAARNAVLNNGGAARNAVPNGGAARNAVPNGGAARNAVPNNGAAAEVNPPPKGPPAKKPVPNLNEIIKELNGTKRPYRKSGMVVRGLGTAAQGLLSGIGRLGSLSATALKRMTRTDAALLAKLQTEIRNLELKENPTNQNRKNIVAKRARIGQLLGGKAPAKRANIAAVAGYATGRNNLPQPQMGAGGPAANNTNFNFSGNPYAEIVRARQVYNKANRATKQQIIAKIMKGMANIWKNRSSNTVAKATLKHIVNRGPKHANITKMYESLAGRGSSSSSSNISKLLGLGSSRSSSSGLASLAPSLLKSLGGSSNIERLLRGRSSSSSSSYPMPPPSYPMPPPSYPMPPPSYPMPPPSYPMPPPLPSLPPSIVRAVNNAGGMKRVNSMINSIGGPEMVQTTSRALVRAHGNINLASKNTGMPPRVFQNIKNLGGPKVATQIVVARRRVSMAKKRRPVPVARRRVAVGRTKIQKKKTRRVPVRKGPTIKDIKRLVHKLRKSELETRVVQCLMR